MRLKGFTLAFWVQLLLGAAFFAFGSGVSALKPNLPTWTIGAAFTVGVCLIVLAAYSAFRAANREASGSGGAGGTARVSGNRSRAFAGDGGGGGDGEGGPGGNAEVTGDRSVAVGGKGGDAGRTASSD
jgi:hypothetical protein